MQNKFLRTLTLSIVFAFSSILISLNLGQVKFFFFKELFNDNNGIFSTLIMLRGYRVLAGFIAGASLAVSGILFQALLKNPLAEPFILGVSSGSAFGAAFSLLFFGGSALLGISLMNVFSFIGAFLACSIVFYLSKIHGKVSITALLLSGVITASVMGSILMFLITMVPGRIVHGVLWWLLGDLQVLDPYSLCFLLVICGSGVFFSFLFSRDLNAMVLGDETASHLGVNVNGIRIILFITASVMAAATVSSCGIIGFVGLITPHFCRLLVGTDHKKLIPVSIFLGGGFLVFTDAIARSVIVGYEIPIGVLTSIIGGPLFLFVMRRKQVN